jgi:hypothetical protein
VTSAAAIFVPPMSSPIAFIVYLLVPRLRTPSFRDIPPLCG